MDQIHPPVHVRLDPRELEDVVIVAEDVKPRKPQLAHILEYELAEAVGSLLVTCKCILEDVFLVSGLLSDSLGCGPVSLDALVRETVAVKMTEEEREANGKTITYYSEEFGY